jgi:cobalt-zinc-cadmium efflux system outer membrane protein
VPATFLLFSFLASVTAAQEPVMQSKETVDKQAIQESRPSLAGFLDNEKGWTPDEAVKYALTHNGELMATRIEVDSARAIVTQSSLRPNASLDLETSRVINGKDNSILAEAALPLEPGGRRAASIDAAQRELEVRQSMFEDLERRLAYETRKKFGDALAAILKLGFVEDMLTTTRRAHRLVAQRVEEGRLAPLEEKVVLVEVNRLRSMRETSKGRAEVAMLELRNLMGMNPEHPLLLRGNFTSMVSAPPPMSVATTRALSQRPDLLASRGVERVAASQIEQARAEGRNKSQGALEATVASAEAAKQRREFLEITVRRQVASAYARYDNIFRAMEIYRVGVREQAGLNLEVVRKMYEVGAKTLLDYLAEQRRFIDLEFDYIDAQLETYLARVEIDGATASPELRQK